MARLWFLSAPLYSHTDWGGFLKTARVLQQRGHDVLWVSGERLTDTIHRANLPFRAIAETGWLWPPPPPPDLTRISPQEAVMVRYRRALDTWLSEDIVAEATRELLALSEQIGPPDAIVTDPFLSAAALAAEVLDAPMIVAGWPAQADLNADNLFPVQRNLGTDSQQRIGRLLDSFNLKGRYFSTGPTPSIVSPYLHICYFTPGWYQAEGATLLPQNIFVGGRPDLPADEPPGWLEGIPVEVPLALITLGSTFTGDLGFFSWGAQAAARVKLLPIVVIGFNPFEPDQKQALIRALPKGTFLLNWVPFEHVLPRTRLMIHHGGMGTTHHAVVHGIPQIVVPHAADQRVQARRVAQARVGLNLSAHDVRQGKLWEGAQALMSYDQVRETARALAQEMTSLGGPERAADSILQVIL
ncbi:MAG: glycosyltransferase [Chloroflexota bacterium]